MAVQQSFRSTPPSARIFPFVLRTATSCRTGDRESPDVDPENEIAFLPGSVLKRDSADRIVILSRFRTRDKPEKIDTPN